MQLSIVFIRHSKQFTAQILNEAACRVVTDCFTAKAGGQVAGRTRKDIESQSDTPVITAKNAAQLNQVVTDLLEGAVSDTTEESKDK